MYPLHTHLGFVIKIESNQYPMISMIQQEAVSFGQHPAHFSTTSVTLFNNTSCHTFQQHPSQFSETSVTLLKTSVILLSYTCQQHLSHF